MIIHETPGLIDIRAFTTFGINAKPNTNNPIGYFGTGLKYAIAVLVREGLKVTVWVGDEPHEFYCEPSNFRGKDFSLIRMRRQRGVTRKWMATDLPFTTELGRNWKLWMALRELHSNTLDEGGVTRLSTFGEFGRESRTIIAIEGEAYEKEFDAIGDIFLDNRGKPENSVCILDRDSKHGYYRGMRVHDLQRPSILTYSVEATLGLTEDRTLSHSFMWDYYVRRAIMGLRDESLIKRVLRAGDDTYEGSIHWQQSEYEYCTPEFLRGVRLWGKKNTTVFIKHERQTKVRELVSWKRRLIDALENNDDTELLGVIHEYRNQLLAMLKLAYTDAENKADAELAASAATKPEEKISIEVASSSIFDEMPF